MHCTEKVRKSEVRSRRRQRAQKEQHKEEIEKQKAVRRASLREVSRPRQVWIKYQIENELEHVGARVGECASQGKARQGEAAGCRAREKSWRGVNSRRAQKDGD